MTPVMTAIGPEVTNGAKEVIDFSVPYGVEFEIHGVEVILFHRWNCEAVAEKAKAAKGSKGKKTDDLESYVWRNDDGAICLPGEYVRQSVINAAKFRQDPRSPRKSAMDLFKAGIVSLTPLAPITPLTTNVRTEVVDEAKAVGGWDFEHRCRVTVQRQGITRVRPAFKAGWDARFVFMVNLPEYISPEMLHDVLSNAGKLVGVADFRPSYGRFQITSFHLTGL